MMVRIHKRIKQKKEDLLRILKAELNYDATTEPNERLPEYKMKEVLNVLYSWSVFQHKSNLKINLKKLQ